MITLNTNNFQHRFDELMKGAISRNGIPICVSQPHNLSRNLGGVKKGVREAFEYNSTTYNGLDYDRSISSINTAMHKSCIAAKGFFIDMASKEFNEKDFFDGVHMTPSGAAKVGRYLFDEFIKQGIY